MPQIIVDLTPFYNFIFNYLLAPNLPPLVLVWRVFVAGGWLIVVPVFLKLAWQLWVYQAQSNYLAKQKYVLLAIEVPKNNQQGPEATERLFAHLMGARLSGTWVDRNLRGYVQATFSFEIVSIEGKIQFLIRCRSNLRELTEAAVYSAYPDAVIKEVEDYTKNAPNKFPDPEWDMWGVDIYLFNKNPYPIRTYPTFEHPITKEFQDPLIAFLEVMNKLGPGEQIWIQFIIEPLSNSWKKEGEALVNKLMGRKPKEKKGWTDWLGIKHVIDIPFEGLRQVGGIGPGGVSSGSGEGGADLTFLNMSPGERRVIEAIQRKIAKLGYRTKIRFIYLARKEVMQKSKAVYGTMGAFNQFSYLDLNGTKLDMKTITSVAYFFPEWRNNRRKTKLMRAYKLRSAWMGGRLCILNTEELATLWHLPLATVKAPLLIKTGSKRGEPPMGLPTKTSI
jgi:hypothetical protein